MAAEPSEYFPQELVYEDDAPLWPPPLSPEFPGFDTFLDFTTQEQWVEASQPPPPATRHQGSERTNWPDSGSIDHRAIELPHEDDEGAGRGSGAEVSRGFRHMMRERQRREKLSQGYADLYSMVSFRSKNDKNSIVQSASAYIRELKGMKHALRRRNDELKTMILGSSNDEAKIKVRAANQRSAVDSLIAELRRLKNMNVKVRAMRADLSKSEISAVML